MKLTPAQIDAITRRGQDVCVVAGPGSGKTRVLIERFAWLVEEQKIDPSRILAITFTEKAATEIKQRLIQRFAARFETEPELRESIERAWVSTIHGFCARLLRENSITAGLAPDFTVLDQPAAESMAREAAESALDQMFSERPAEMRGVLESLDLSTDDYARKPDLARGLLDVYESMRVAGLRDLPMARVAEDIWPRARELAETILADRSAAGKHVPLLRDFAARLLALGEEVTIEHFAALNPSDRFHLNRIGNGTRAHAAAKELKDLVIPLLQQQWVADWYAGSAALLREAISRIDALYREAKRNEAAIDFAGLEEETIRLLENDPELCERTASRFDQILMDELQDTNALQWKLVGLIRRSLFAVGDINQSIYGFRHAEPAVFGRYRDSLIQAGASVDDLRENHRSLPEILGAVSRILDGQKGIEPRPLVASRSPAGESAGPVVELLVGRGDEANAVDQERVDGEEVEASMVAARIREFCPDNRGSGRVALKDIAILVRALGATKPFERALDRFGIPFVVSGGRTFLEAREVRDVMALLAALVNPLDQIAVVGVLRSPLVGMVDEKILAMGRDGLRAEFERWFGKLRAMAGFVAPDLLLASALDECGYAAGLTDRARANIEKFLAHIRREHRRQPSPLAEVLDSLEALRATQSEAEAPPPEAGNVVRLMTIHAAKGLEFPIVFVSALHRGIDQSKPVIASSPQAGLGAKWRNPFTGAGQPDRAHKKIVEEIKEREAAEENRLLYVAMTRAEDHLILSCAEKKRLSGWPKLVTEAIAATTIGDRVLPAPDTEARAAQAQAVAESAQWLDPPAIASRHDAAAPVTSIALFHACPRKYLLTSIGSGTQRRFDSSLEKSGGEEDGADFEKSNDFADDYGDAGIAFGSEVHRLLAMENGAMDAKATNLPGAAELASRFNGSDLGQRAARATRIEREFDFLFYFEDVVLRGQIDLWFEEGGELIVVDYKTDRVSDDQEFSKAYVLQLQIYALALERYAGRAADRAVLYYLRPDGAIDVPADPETARAAVRAFLKAQDAAGDPLNPHPMNAYPMKPGEQCRRCGFFGHLCVGTGAAEGAVDQAAG